jgi:dipeptidase E
MKKTFLFFAILMFSSMAGSVSAHQPRIIYSQPGNIQISNPEISQAFYDNLTGKARNYFIDSSNDFELYINLLVPEIANREGRYSANVFSVKGGGTEQIASIDGASFDWKEFYESFGRDYYLKGPEFSKQLPAGKYKIEIYSKDNQGEYVLAVGKTESFDAQSILNVYWQLPLLKITFFKTSVLQFFLTPFGIAGIGAVGVLLVFAALIYYLIGVIRGAIKHSQAKTLLLTSGGMTQMKDEIIKLLQKPAYDVTVAFISTAAKPEENLDYLKNDWNIMKDELGFNVEEVDIEGKKDHEVMKLLELKDIIYVEGGNTFYLLKAMRACKFEKVIRKLLKSGKVYIGVSAGSIVAGKTIKTSNWKNPEPDFGVKNLKGLNLVPFDIFVHYKPENAEIIKQKIKNPKKRLKQLKILTDDQAILVQGKEVDLIGEGEAVIV